MAKYGEYSDALRAVLKKAGFRTTRLHENSWVRDALAIVAKADKDMRAARAKASKAYHEGYYDYEREMLGR